MKLWVETSKPFLVLHPYSRNCAKSIPAKKSHIVNKTSPPPSKNVTGNMIILPFPKLLLFLGYYGEQIIQFWVELKNNKQK